VLNQIAKNTQNDNEEFTLFERTPSRNKVVHSGKMGNSANKNFDSPFKNIPMVKQTSNPAQNYSRPFADSRSSGLNANQLICGKRNSLDV